MQEQINALKEKAEGLEKVIAGNEDLIKKQKAELRAYKTAVATLEKLQEQTNGQADISE